MPLPLNQKTKRVGTSPAAYAVPFELNIAASGGSPTRIAAPVMLMFLRNRRLLSGIVWSPRTLRLRQSFQELRRADERQQQRLEAESRFLERRERAPDR